MRLIDAEELEGLAYEMFVHARTPGEQIAANTIKGMIDNSPTIDAVPIVRCKDCKHWWEKNELCHHEKTMDGSVCCLEAKPDFYCGYGEKKST